MSSLQNRAQTSKPRTPKHQNLIFGPGTEGGTPDWDRFGPFRIKLCPTKPKTVASLQNRAQTSKPRTPKHQNLTIWTRHRREEPQICTDFVRSVSNFAQRSPKPWPAFKTELKPQNLEPQNTKTLFLDPALREEPQTGTDLARSVSNFAQRSPNPWPSFKTELKTSNPKTSKPDHCDPALKGGTPDLHRFGPFRIKLCSTKRPRSTGLPWPGVYPPSLALGLPPWLG